MNFENQYEGHTATAQERCNDAIEKAFGGDGEVAIALAGIAQAQATLALAAATMALAEKD
jgi:hypothetical protein